MKKFLGIDYGTKRIGLAVNFASLVEPLLVVDNQIDQTQPIISASALKQIVSLCQEKNIDEVVLGFSEAEMGEKIKLFAEILRKSLDLPVILSDETLSSYEVGQRMRAASLSLKKRQGPIDHYSAAIILEDFLETNTRL